MTTEPKHTPGPWTEERLYQALNGRATKDEARLIVFAPELLAALEEVDEWHDLIRQHYPEMRFPQKVRAVLAKAKG